MNNDNIFIFDLDRTTVNSEHREGRGSLSSWFANATAENILKDSPMYLGQFIGILFNLGFRVIICTSRSMTKADYEFLYTKLYVPVGVKIISRTIPVILILLGITLHGADKKISVLLIDGQNNHAVWPKSTIMMKQYLEDTGLFEVEINRPQFTWKGDREKEYLPLAGVGKTEDLPKSQPDPNFAPKFSNYDVVINNFGWQAADWSEATKKSRFFLRLAE